MKEAMPSWKVRRHEMWCLINVTRSLTSDPTQANQIEFKNLDPEEQGLLLCAFLGAGCRNSIPGSIVEKLIATLQNLGRHTLVGELLVRFSRVNKSSKFSNAVLEYLFSIQDMRRYETVVAESSLCAEDEIFHRFTLQLTRSPRDPLSLLEFLPEKMRVRVLFERRVLLQFLSEKCEASGRLIELYTQAIAKHECSAELVISLQKFIIRKRLCSTYAQAFENVVSTCYPNVRESEEYQLWHESYGIRNSLFPSPTENFSGVKLSREYQGYLRTHVSWLTDPLAAGDLCESEVYRSAAIQGEVLCKCIVLSGSVWGESIYTDGLFDFALTSLVQSGEIRRLQSLGRVVVSIHTTSESSTRLLERIGPFERQVGISFRVLATLGKEDAGALKQRAIAYMLGLVDAAKHQHFYVGLCPDGLYGEGLSKLVGRVSDGQAAFGTLIRISKRKFIARFDRDIKSLFSPSSESLNERLVKLGLGVMPHEVAVFYIQNRLPGIRYEVDSALRSYFQTAYMNLWVLRPTLAMLREMLQVSGPRYNNAYLEHLVQPLDHELAHALNARGMLISPRSFEEFIFLELTDDRGYSNVSKGLELPITENFFDIDSFKVKIEPRYRSLISGLKKVRI